MKIALHSRIVHQHVDLLDLVGQLAEERANLLGLGDVELDGHHLDAVTDLLVDVGGNLLKSVDAPGRQHELEVAGAGAGKLEGR